MAYNYPMISIQRQRGVALIMAVVTVAIVALIAVAMSAEQNLLVRRVQNTILLDSAWQYALGGEQFAALALKREQEQGKKNNEDYDYPRERHLSDEFTFPLENVGGVITGDMKDLQGKFNLTNLQQNDGSMDLNARTAFEGLLLKLQLPRDLLSVIEDWMDADQELLPDGAEDSYYQTLESPYMTANQSLKSVEELRLLKGFNEPYQQQNIGLAPNQDEEEEEKTIYDVLSEHVVVLPTRTALNVNTATAPVLQAYFDHITAQQAEKLVEKAQSDKPFESLEAFKNDGNTAPPAGKDPKAVFQNVPDAGVKSEYFEVNLTVSLGGIETPLYSVLKRNLDDGKVYVVRRSRGKI